MLLTFKHTDDGCCQLCNPASLADLETTCVLVELGSRRTWVCHACIDALGGVAATRRKRTRPIHKELVEFARDMQWWSP